MTPEKPKLPTPPKSIGPRRYDDLLDPLPLPEVVESDSDTAWGLWEDSLQTHVEVPPSKDRGDTEPMGLDDPATAPKPRNS